MSQRRGVGTQHLDDSEGTGSLRRSRRLSGLPPSRASPLKKRQNEAVSKSRSKKKTQEKSKSKSKRKSNSSKKSNKSRKSSSKKKSSESKSNGKSNKENKSKNAFLSNSRKKVSKSPIKRTVRRPTHSLSNTKSPTKKKEGAGARAGARAGEAAAIRTADGSEAASPRKIRTPKKSVKSIKKSKKKLIVKSPKTPEKQGKEEHGYVSPIKGEGVLTRGQAAVLAVLSGGSTGRSIKRPQSRLTDAVLSGSTTADHSPQKPPAPAVITRTPSRKTPKTTKTPKKSSKKSSKKNSKKSSKKNSKKQTPKSLRTVKKVTPKRTSKKTPTKTPKRSVKKVSPKKSVKKSARKTPSKRKTVESPKRSVKKSSKKTGAGAAATAKTPKKSTKKKRNNEDKTPKSRKKTKSKSRSGSGRSEESLARSKAAKARIKEAVRGNIDGLTPGKLPNDNDIDLYGTNEDGYDGQHIDDIDPMSNLDDFDDNNDDDGAATAEDDNKDGDNGIAELRKSSTEVISDESSPGDENDNGNDNENENENENASDSNDGSSTVGDQSSWSMKDRISNMNNFDILALLLVFIIILYYVVVILIACKIITSDTFVMRYMVMNLDELIAKGWYNNVLFAKSALLNLSFLFILTKVFLRYQAKHSSFLMTNVDNNIPDSTRAMENAYTSLHLLHGLTFIVSFIFVVVSIYDSKQYGNIGHRHKTTSNDTTASANGGTVNGDDATIVKYGGYLGITHDRLNVVAVNWHTILESISVVTLGFYMAQSLHLILRFGFCNKASKIEMFSIGSKEMVILRHPIWVRDIAVISLLFWYQFFDQDLQINTILLLSIKSLISYFIIKKYRNISSSSWYIVDLFATAVALHAGTFIATVAILDQILTN